MTYDSSTEYNSGHVYDSPYQGGGMAKDFIKIDQTVTTAKFAGPLKQFVDEVRTVIDLGEKLKGVMDHNVSGADYADVETLMGLTTGNGDDVYNLVSGTIGALKGTVQSSDALTLIDRVG